MRYPDALFLLPFALVIGWLVLRIVKYGFKGSIFGASVERTVGEVSPAASKLLRTRIKVHQLGGDPEQKAVGLEFVVFLGSTPCSLSVAEARELIALLESATRGR